MNKTQKMGKNNHFHSIFIGLDISPDLFFTPGGM
jgi:hypothetical protein